MYVFNTNTTLFTTSINSPPNGPRNSSNRMAVAADGDDEATASGTPPMGTTISRSNSSRTNQPGCILLSTGQPIDPKNTKAVDNDNYCWMQSIASAMATPA